MFETCQQVLVVSLHVLEMHAEAEYNVSGFPRTVICEILLLRFLFLRLVFYFLFNLSSIP